LGGKIDASKAAAELPQFKKERPASEGGPYINAEIHSQLYI
jgi:hypothetical protein